MIQAPSVDLPEVVEALEEATAALPSVPSGSASKKSASRSAQYQSLHEQIRSSQLLSSDIKLEFQRFVERNADVSQSPKVLRKAGRDVGRGDVGLLKYESPRAVETKDNVKVGTEMGNRGIEDLLGEILPPR